MMKILMTRRVVGLAWGNLPLLVLLLLLACLGPPLAASQSPPSLEAHGNTAATNFSCIGKVIGGYYADVDTGCQMFHVCTLNEKGKAHYYTFRCLAGTVFDQETRVCERADEVDCGRTESFFYLNNDLYGPGIIPSTAHIRVIDEGEVRQGTLDAVQTVDTPTTTTTTPAPPFVFPETSFTCVDKIPGGLYADVETGCTVFHICSVEPNSGVKDNKFICGPGTLFDQSTRTCQAIAEVDCAAAPSLYYLNDRRNLPDSTSVDLCRSRALGSPLADITTGCRHYTVCQAGAGGRLVEIRMECKKDQLFSQLQKRCTSAKKVQCAKETLSEILGLGQGLDGAVEGRRRRRRMALSLQNHRFRRAALPPLVNLVIAPGVEDARVRRALYNLAALRQWTLENARHSTFIELYALQTEGEDDHYQKKSYPEDTLPHDSSEASRVYQHVNRKKRDLDNSTVAEQDLLGNHTKAEETTDSLAHGNLPHTELSSNAQSVTGSLLHPTTIHTKTVGQKTNIFSISTVSRQRESSTTPSIPATPPPPPVIPTTLSTFTVSPVRTSVKTTSTTTVTVTPITVTVTTTIITSAKDAPTETVLTDTSRTAPATLNPTSVTTPLSRTISSTASDLDGKITFTPMPELIPVNLEDEGGSNNTESTSTSTEVPTAHSSISTEESFESSTAQSPVPNKKDPQEALEGIASESDSEGIAEPQELLTTTSEPLTSTTPLADSSKNSQSVSTTEAPASPEASISNITTTSTETPEPENTIETLNNSSTTPSINATSPTTERSTDIMAPSGSINVSTTGTPETSGSSNVSTTTESPVTPQGTPQGTFTSDNLPKTNFTCKDKKLEQFYPDPEANCQVFHYCSPGFVKKQVLDLKFLCTGATMFDVSTQKCEDMSSVTCGQEPTPSSVNDTTTTESTTASYNVTTTTHVLTNATSEPPEKITTESVFTTKQPTNMTEALNVTTATPTTTSSHDTTTKIFQVIQPTDKETNWNGTKHKHHVNDTTDDSLDTTVATEETVIETTTITEDPQLAEPEDKTEINLPESTTIKATEEPITVMEYSITEVVTEEDIRDESMDKDIPVSIAGVSTQVDIEPETATELGPIMHHEVIEETKTVAEDTSIATTEEATQVPLAEVKTESTLGTSLDHSEPVLQETSTEVSVSTDVSAFSSSDSISSEASVSSAIPTSQNITTSSSVEPLEKGV